MIDAVLDTICQYGVSYYCRAIALGKSAKSVERSSGLRAFVKYYSAGSGSATCRFDVLSPDRTLVRGGKKMKRNSGLLFALVVLVLAVGFTSSAIGDSAEPAGPNDNQSASVTTTQHNQVEEQGAGPNDNQKGVLICQRRAPLAKKHFKHGDACVAPINADPARRRLAPRLNRRSARTDPAPVSAQPLAVMRRRCIDLRAARVRDSASSLQRSLRGW